MQVDENHNDVKPADITSLLKYCPDLVWETGKNSQSKRQGLFNLYVPEEETLKKSIFRYLRLKHIQI